MSGFARLCASPLAQFVFFVSRACPLRPVLALAALACLGASGASAATYTVNSTGDTGAGSGTSGDLRYAINQANANFNSTIQFSVTGAITLTSALPTITVRTTIAGPGANVLTIAGGGPPFAGSIFTVNAGTDNVFISGLTISGGTGTVNSGATYGGGLLIDNGNVFVINCTFSGNSVTGAGGAIMAFTGALHLTGSTFIGNSAAFGGAITTQAFASIANNTFSGNTATGQSNANGGAINAFGTVDASNNTFVGNSAINGGGAILLNSGQLTADNNLFSGNSVGPAGGGAIYNASPAEADADFNVYYNNLAAGSEDDCFGCTTNTNATSATSNPLTLPLGLYGGTTQTFLPKPDSQAICAGSSSLVSIFANSIDQRGAPMFPGYSPCPSGQVDAGAVQTNYITVQSSGDTGSGSGDCPGAGCTLRDVVDNFVWDIDFAPGISTINLNPAKGGLGFGGIGLNIIGPGASLLTVNGGGSGSDFSVFTVAPGGPGSATLYGLTLARGNTHSSIGGGGIHNAGTLTLLDCAVSGNSSAAVGGGIDIDPHGTLAILESTVSGNTAVDSGGGIYNAGALTITRSTIAGNSVSGDSVLGGGVFSNFGATLTIAGSTIAGNSVNGAFALGGGITSAGPLTLTGSTVSGNTADGGPGGQGASGGIGLINGTFTVANSIVAANSLGSSGLGDNADIGGNTSLPYADNGGNQASNDPSPTSIINIQLSPLGDNGGPTQTMLPLPGSPAICAGLRENIPSGVTVDERGFPNTNSLYPGYSQLTRCVDSGAVQTNYAMAFSQQPSTSSITAQIGVGQQIAPTPVVSVTESGTPVTGATVNMTAAAGTLSGTASQATSAGSATFSGLSIGQIESGDTLTATLPLNPALSTPLALTDTTYPFDVVATTTTTGAGTSANYSQSSQSVSLTATVTSGANPVNEGTVTFGIFQGATLIGSEVTSSTVSGGVFSATYTLPADTPAGPYSIHAAFNGDSNYGLSSDTTATLTVNVVTPTFTWTPPSTIIFGDAGTNVLNASLNCVSCGSISYTETPNGSGTAVAITTTAGLPVGAYTITAIFSPGSADYNSVSATQPLTVSGQSVWVVNSGGGTAELAGNGYPITSSAYPGANTAVAIDSAGNVWTIGSGSTLLEGTSQTGIVQHALSSGGGLDAPNAIAIDGNSKLWITNAGNNSISLFLNNGTATSPSNGFTDSSLSAPSGVAVDLGGSVWITNQGNNKLTRLLGAAAPAAPLSTAAANNTTGAKP